MVTFSVENIYHLVHLSNEKLKQNKTKKDQWYNFPKTWSILDYTVKQTDNARASPAILWLKQLIAFLFSASSNQLFRKKFRFQQ